MSGGSMNYICHKLSMEIDNMRLSSPLRRAFYDHIQDVIKALHAIEWVDSGDTAEGTEEESIRKCLTSEKFTKHASKEAEELLKELDIILGRSFKHKEPYEHEATD